MNTIVIAEHINKIIPEKQINVPALLVPRRLPIKSFKYGFIKHPMFTPIINTVFIRG